MKTIKETVKDVTIPAVVSFWAIALGVLSAATFETQPVNAIQPAPVAQPQPVETVNETVGQAIATQGNQALREILAESTRLQMPALPPKAAR